MTGDNDQGRSLSQSQNQSSYGGQGSRRPLSDGAPNLPHQQSTDDMSYDQNASYQVMSQTRTQQGTESSRPGGTQTYWQHTRSSHNLANFGNDSANTFPPSQSCYPNALGRQSLRVSDHASVSPSGAQQQTPKILAEQGAFRNLTLTNRPSRSRRDSATAGLRNVQPSNSVAGPSTGVRNTARSTNRNPPSNNRRSSDDDLLDENYKTRDSPRKFFVPGKVFHALWTEEATVPNQDTQSSISKAWTQTSYGSWLYVKPRRFVVIRASDFYCIVLPITSYGGRGVAKEGVRKSNHAIVHIGKQAPQPSIYELPRDGELAMLPYPIRIDPDRPDIRLDSMSRIDFGKVHPIDHKCKVKSLGMVNSASTVHLMMQFYQTMGVPAAHALSSGLPQPVHFLANANTTAARLETNGTFGRLSSASGQDYLAKAYNRLLEKGWREEDVANALWKLGEAETAPVVGGAAGPETGNTEHDNDEMAHGHGFS